MSDFLDSVLPHVFGALMFTFLLSLLYLGHVDTTASRTCRENVAKLETPRTAAEIAAICK